MSMPQKGQWAEISQPSKAGAVWLPFLVTVVYDEDTVSGVAFCGHPFSVGWNRPVADFAHVRRGEANRQWREVTPVVEGEAGSVDVADAVKAALREFMPNPDEFSAMVREMAAEAVGEALAARAEDEGEPKAAPEPDDLTVIPKLGDVAAAWLDARGVDSFDMLANLHDRDIEDFAARDDVPGGVTAERLREWREDAATRV